MVARTDNRAGFPPDLRSSSWAKRRMIARGELGYHQVGRLRQRWSLRVLRVFDGRCRRKRAFTQGIRRARCVHPRDFSAAQAMVYERLQFRSAFGLRYILGGVAVGLNRTQMMARTRCPLPPDRCWPVHSSW